MSFLFKTHTAQSKGGWMCPAAKIIRRTWSCDAKSSKLLLLLCFLFRCLLGFLCHGGTPLLED